MAKRASLPVVVYIMPCGPCVLQLAKTSTAIFLQTATVKTGGVLPLATVTVHYIVVLPRRGWLVCCRTLEQVGDVGVTRYASIHFVGELSKIRKRIDNQKGGIPSLRSFSLLKPVLLSKLICSDGTFSTHSIQWVCYRRTKQGQCSPNTWWSVVYGTGYRLKSAPASHADDCPQNHNMLNGPLKIHCTSEDRLYYGHPY